MYRAKDLDYVPVSTVNWPPTLICHCCGKKLPEQETGCFMAQIEFAQDGTCDFHFCSDKCVEMFSGHPAADTMINDVVSKSKKIHGG